MRGQDEQNRQAYRIALALGETGNRPPQLTSAPSLYEIPPADNKGALLESDQLL